jgi:hypothetical protein
MSSNVLEDVIFPARIAQVARIITSILLKDVIISRIMLQVLEVQIGI